MEEEVRDCLERALFDLELLQAAYPDEIEPLDQNDDALRCRLKLSSNAFVDLLFPQGYPSEKELQVTSQQCTSSTEKQSLDKAVVAIRREATMSFQAGEEHGLVCCASAIEAFQNSMESIEIELPATVEEEKMQNRPLHCDFKADWITGEPLTDRKSAFIAHVCHVTSEAEVRHALSQLLDGNSKLARASHNMYAWRVTEKQRVATDDGEGDMFRLVEKHDNSDDGEDGAGSRLAHLLQMRKEKDVLVVVSRWFGGIHLGPKRFAHISNVAQQLLKQYHDDATP